MTHLKLIENGGGSTSRLVAAPIIHKVYRYTYTCHLVCRRHLHLVAIKWKTSSMTCMGSTSLMASVTSVVDRPVQDFTAREKCSYQEHMSIEISLTLAGRNKWLTISDQLTETVERKLVMATEIRYIFTPSECALCIKIGAAYIRAHSLLHRM